MESKQFFFFRGSRYFGCIPPANDNQPLTFSLISWEKRNAEYEVYMLFFQPLHECNDNTNVHVRYIRYIRYI